MTTTSTRTTQANQSAGNRDTGSSASGTAPIGLALLGVMTVAAAFVALVVAGIAAGDVFSPSGDAASDQGVWMATQAWATPLALTGLAVIFAGAIPLALRNVRSSISFRRDSMANGLPRILHGKHTHTTNTASTRTTNTVTTNSKENVR
jgi:hypothetical protein